MGTDRLQFPTGAALHTEDDTAGQWVHYGADLGNNDWVQLRGVHGASLAQLTGSGGTTPTPTPPPPSGGPTAGNDALTGTDSADTINALAGNDSVDGRGGNDTIAGGPGTDTLTGAAGADVFVHAYGDGGSQVGYVTDFQVGTDRLQFPTGAALHTEDDTAGQWVHYGADLGNNDWVQLRGVHGASLAQLTGSGGTTPTPTPPPPSGGPTAGNDALTGTDSADTINALAGNDSVDGRGGNDTIAGGPGTDTLTGAAGADVFVHAYGDGGSQWDYVTDFQVGTDRLQFPTGAALHTEDDTAGQWVHYGADLGNNDWVQLRGVHGASLAQLIG